MVVRKWLAACCVTYALGVNVQLFANGNEDLTDMSLADLLNMDVTTVSKFVEKLSDAPGVVTVITKDELERFGGTTLKDILERVPSFNRSTVYMTDRSMISARGDQFKNSGSHVLLLINGRPVREILEGGIKSEMLESFPVNIIERIEVIRGPGSVLYGSGAFSGVINIIAEKAERTGITIEGLGGVPSAYGALGKVKCRLGDLSVVAAGRYQEKQEWEVDWEYTDSIVVSKKVNIPNKGPGAYLGISYKNLRLISSYAQWDNYYFMPHRMTLFPNAYGKAYWKKGFADLGYSLKVSEKWNMDFNLTYTRSTFEVSSWPDVTRDSYEAIIEYTNFINPINNLRLVAGGLYNYMAGEEGVDFNTQYSFGLYSQIDYRVLRNLKLIGGMQANKPENIDMDLVSRVGLVFYPTFNLNIKILFSQAFRAPGINEVTLDFPTLQGNPDIRPEKVNTIDVGVNYLGKRIQGGINYYFSKQNDVIFQDRSVVPNMYNNIGKIEHQGVELEGKYYLNKEFLLLFSMLYQVNEDKDGNDNVTPIANLGGKAGISYKSEKGVTMSLFNTYHGSLDEKYDTEVNPSPGAYNIMNLNCRFDLYKLTGWKYSRGLSLVLKGDNLLNKELWLPNWGIPLGYSIPVDQGRTVYLGMDASL